MTTATRPRTMTIAVPGFAGPVKNEGAAYTALSNEAIERAILRTRSTRPMRYEAELVEGHPSDTMLKFLVRRNAA